MSIKIENRPSDYSKGGKKGVVMKGFIEVTQNQTEKGTDYKTLIAVKDIKIVDQFSNRTLIVLESFPLKKENFYTRISVIEPYSEVIEKIAQALA